MMCKLKTGDILILFMIKVYQNKFKGKTNYLNEAALLKRIVPFEYLNKTRYYQELLMVIPDNTEF